MDLSPRVRAVCDLDVSEVREYAGRHEYDGKPQDLSPAGVRAGLDRLAAARDGGGRLADAHDEAHLAAAEEYKRVTYAELELHRRNPILHLGELDLAGYDRDYAPQAERDAARAEHLAAWPRVADAAVESLDQVSAPVAQALLGGIRGLAAGLSAGPGSAGPGARGQGARGQGVTGQGVTGQGAARLRWPPPGPRTPAWSRTSSARLRTAIPTRRWAPPRSPP